MYMEQIPNKISIRVTDQERDIIARYMTENSIRYVSEVIKIAIKQLDSPTPPKNMVRVVQNRGQY